MPHASTTVSRAESNRHIERLIERNPGLTITHIAHLAGLSHGSVRDKRYDRITRETHERIMAVDDRLARMAPVRVAQPLVAAHIERLLAVEGAGVTALARVAGLSVPGVRFVRSGRYQHVQWATARALLSITPADMAANTAWVDRAPTMRKIGSLAAMGWNYRAQKALVDGKVDIKNLMTPEHVVREKISRRIAVLVDDLYRRIGGTPGPDHVAARHARANGFHPPMFYDDEGVYIFGVERNERAERAAAALGRTQEAARTRLACAALTVHLVPTPVIAARLGVDSDYIKAARARAGLKVAHQGKVDLTEASAPYLPLVLAAAQGLDLDERTDLFDEPDIDYLARWDHLKDTVAADRKAAAAAQAEATEQQAA